MRNDDSFDDGYAAPSPPDRTDDVGSAETRDRVRQVRDRIGELLGRRGATARLTVAASVVSCLSLAMFAEVPTGSAEPAVSVDRVAVLADRALADQAANRATRDEPASAETPAPDATADPDVQEQPASEQSAPSAETATPTEEPAPPVDPGPVAGLTHAQMNNAKAIVRTGRDMQMPRRALIIAVATAMQESNLLNLASGVLPESMNYPNQGVGWDHDSVGLFQQRSSTGWGPVARLMDPAYATAQFLEALMRVPGWQWMRLTEAAQAVQVSAFPEHYAKHEGRATAIVDAIVPGWQ